MTHTKISIHLKLDLDFYTKFDIKFGQKKTKSTTKKLRLYRQECLLWLTFDIYIEITIEQSQFRTGWFWLFNIDLDSGIKSHVITYDWREREFGYSYTVISILAKKPQSIRDSGVNFIFHTENSNITYRNTITHFHSNVKHHIADNSLDIPSSDR